MDFLKKAVLIFWENGKSTVSVGQVSFEEKGTSGDENEYITFFMENEVLNIFSFNNFFEKINIFGENGEKILEGHDHFLGEGIILC